jgi:hypothetical protein
VKSWVLLLYKVAPEPSARRVYVWRKLKRLGALLLHDAVWVLPDQPYTREQFQWLAAEIHEMEGSAMVWEAQLALDGRDDALTAQFLDQVDTLYREILADLDRPEPDVVALTRRYQQASQIDYLHSPVGPYVRDRLAAAREQPAREPQAHEEHEEQRIRKSEHERQRGGDR